MGDGRGYHNISTILILYEEMLTSLVVKALVVYAISTLNLLEYGSTAFDLVNW